MSTSSCPCPCHPHPCHTLSSRIPTFSSASCPHLLTYLGLQPARLGAGPRYHPAEDRHVPPSSAPHALLLARGLAARVHRKRLLPCCVGCQRELRLGRAAGGAHRSVSVGGEPRDEQRADGKQQADGSREGSRRWQQRGRGAFDRAAAQQARDRSRAMPPLRPAPCALCPAPCALRPAPCA